MKSRYVFRLMVTALTVVTALGCHAGQTQSKSSNGDPQFEATYEWTQLTEHAEFPVGYNYPVYVARGKMWAFHTDSIWASANGRTWTKSGLATIRKNVYQSQYIQFRDSIYALGDNSGNYEKMRFLPKIRRTTDFKNWETLSVKSNLPERIFFGLGVFNDKIWIFGGYDGKSYHNDVWNSPDGVTWTRVTEKAGWSPRNIGTSTVFKDKIFVIGGGTIDGTPNPNLDSDREIWSSPDGVTWTKV